MIETREKGKRATAYAGWWVKADECTAPGVVRLRIGDADCGAECRLTQPQADRLSDDLRRASRRTPE